jgi:hypothetical protein
MIALVFNSYYPVHWHTPKQIACRWVNIIFTFRQKRALFEINLFQMLEEPHAK